MHCICDLFFSLTEDSHWTDLPYKECVCFVTELFGIEAVRSVLQQVAQNPQLMTNMLQAPYVQSMIQSMSNNPSLVLQVNH